MIGALLAVFGLVVSIWSIGEPLQREWWRIRLRSKWTVLTWLLFASVFIVIGWAVVSLLLVLLCKEWERSVAIVDLVGTIGVIAISGGMLYIWLHEVEWTAKTTAEARPQIASLITGGQESVVAGLLAVPLQKATVVEAFRESRIEELLIIAFRSPRFAAAFVREKPAAAAHLLTINAPEIGRFSDAVITAAYDHGQGVLATELPLALNFNRPRVGYRLPEDCHFLRALFNDCEVANRLHAWQPVAQEFIDDLQRKTPETTDPGNRVWRHDHDDSESPGAVCLGYFRVMISNSMEQGVRWHMWLYWLPHFVRALLRVNRVQAENAGEEYPTLYLYSVRECFSILEDVIDQSARLDANNPHAADIPEDTIERNAHIPGSAMSAYAQMLCDVVKQPGIPVRYRQDAVRSAASLYSELRGRNPPRNFAAIFLSNLVENGARGGAVYDILHDLRATEDHARPTPPEFAGAFRAWLNTRA